MGVDAGSGWEGEVELANHISWMREPRVVRPANSLAGAFLVIGFLLQRFLKARWTRARGGLCHSCVYEVGFWSLGECLICLIVFG